MANMLQLGLRGVQFVFTLITMALIGNIIQTASAGNPSIINFSMFVAVFSMLTLIYAIAICFKEEMTFHKLIPSALDVINAILFFIAATALAAYLGVHSCNNRGYLASNRITNGAGNMKARCHMSQAATTFMFFNMFLYIVTSLLSLTGGRANLRSGGLKPSMSQRV